MEFKLIVELSKGFWLLGAVFLCTTGAEALVFGSGTCRQTQRARGMGFCKDMSSLKLFRTRCMAVVKSRKNIWAIKFHSLQSCPSNF